MKQYTGIVLGCVGVYLNDQIAVHMYLYYIYIYIIYKFIYMFGLKCLRLLHA